MAQRHHPHLGRLHQAFHLQAHELVFALAQRARGQHPLLLHQRPQLTAQRPGRHAHEAPGLHEAHTGPVVRGHEQATHHLGRHRTTREVAHVPALDDGAVHGLALGGRESQFWRGQRLHGEIGRHQSSMPRWAGMPAWWACWSSGISGTVSASAAGSASANTWSRHMVDQARRERTPSLASKAESASTSGLPVVSSFSP